MKLKNNFFIGLLLLANMVLTIIPVPARAIFSDISPSHPHYEAITQLEESGIIGGYQDGSFRPDLTVNRAEALKVILLGSKISIPSLEHNAGFSDVDPEAWFSKYVYSAKSLGIIRGQSGDRFSPQKAINLAEALKIIVHTNQFPIDLLASESPYPDVKAKAWYAVYFVYAKENNLIQTDSQGNVNPQQDLTRADLAELMYRAKLHKESLEKEAMQASFYSDIFNGRKTSSGEIFDNNKLTAAHRTFPFGTQVRVTNLRNEKSVVVVINDRGPYHHKRIIDLSKAAFSAIAPLSNGVIPVKVEIIDNQGNEFMEMHYKNMREVALPDLQCEYPEDRTSIEKQAFDDIYLSQELPKMFLENELFVVKGRINTKISTKQVALFIKDQQGNLESFYADLNSDNSFSIPVLFSKTGQYQLGIIPGLEGVSKAYKIEVIKACNKVLATDYNTKAPQWSLELSGNQVFLKLDKNPADLARFLLFQNERRSEIIINNSDNKVALPLSVFKNFKAGQGFIQVATAPKSSNFSIDQQKSWNFADPKELDLSQRRTDMINNEFLTSVKKSSTYIRNGHLSFQATLKQRIKSEAYLILPDGNVEKVNLESDNKAVLGSHNSKVFPKNSIVKFSYKPSKSGTYTLSLYNPEGENIMNHSFYPTSALAIIPDNLELNEDSDNITSLKDDLSRLRLKLLFAINNSRKSLGKSTLNLNEDLNKLAQHRSEDMLKNNYFGHFNLQGADINEIRKRFNINNLLSENLARNYSINKAHSGLMNSGSHRFNIIQDNWAEVGIGIALDSDGALIVTELFMEKELSIKDLKDYRSKIMATINKERLKKKLGALLPDTNLSNVAQKWSNNMANKHFFSLSDPDSGASVYDELDQYNISGEMGVYIVYNTSLNNLDQTVIEKAEIFADDWEKIGIGISQDQEKIKLTIVYSSKN